MAREWQLFQGKYHQLDVLLMMVMQECWGNATALTYSIVDDGCVGVLRQCYSYHIQVLCVKGVCAGVLGQCYSSRIQYVVDGYTGVLEQCYRFGTQ